METKRVCRIFLGRLPVLVDCMEELLGERIPRYPMVEVYLVNKESIKPYGLREELTLQLEGVIGCSIPVTSDRAKSRSVPKSIQIFSMEQLAKENLKIRNLVHKDDLFLSLLSRQGQRSFFIGILRGIPFIVEYLRSRISTGKEVYTIMITVTLSPKLLRFWISH